MTNDIGRQIKPSQGLHSAKKHRDVFEAVAAQIKVCQAREEREVLRKRSENVLGDVKGFQILTIKQRNDERTMWAENKIETGRDGQTTFFETSTSTVSS